MDKTKIDWCDSTWNPVTGCLHGCEYCYAKNYATYRFGGASETHCNATVGTECQWCTEGTGEFHVLDEPLYDPDRGRNAPYPYEFDPTFHRYRLDDYQGKKGRNIFVCSMADLFGEWVPDEWIEEVFAACEQAPQHNYLFLTKNPDRYMDIMHNLKRDTAPRFYFGLTVTDEYYARVAEEIIGYCYADLMLFLSVEPLHADISGLVDFEGLHWVIIGAETGNRKGKIIPERTWVENIVRECRAVGVPVFMKSSLAEIWGEPLIQEFPKQLVGRGKHM